MKRNELFVVKEICGSKYLLPIGQMIAEYNKGIRINATCEYVWEQLKVDITFDELLKRYVQKYGAIGEEKDFLKRDLEELVKALKNRGMLVGSKNIFGCSCRRCQTGQVVCAQKYQGFTSMNIDSLEESLPIFGTFIIGGLPVKMYGTKEYFDESFEKFRCDDFSGFPSDYDPVGCSETPENPCLSAISGLVQVKDTGKTNTSAMHIKVFDAHQMQHRNQDSDPDYYDKDGSDYLYIDEDENEDEADELRENQDIGFIDMKTASDDSDNSDAAYYENVLIHSGDLTVLEHLHEYVLFFSELNGVEELHMTKDGEQVRVYCAPPSDNVRFCLFHALRMAFLVYALKNGRVMLHSSSILFNNRAWAFSGASGTGKSTHCALWSKMYGVRVLNGDLNLVGLENGIPYVYGTPWCGSSGIFDCIKRKLGGIILLKQSKSNRIEDLSEEKKVLLVQQRLTTSVWDKNMLDETFNIVTRLTKNLYVKRYYCNKEDEAAALIREDITALQRN